MVLFTGWIPCLKGNVRFLIILQKKMSLLFCVAHGRVKL